MATHRPQWEAASARLSLNENNRGHFAQEAATSVISIQKKRKQAVEPVRFWTEAGPDRVVQRSTCASRGGGSRHVVACSVAFTPEVRVVRKRRTGQLYSVCVPAPGTCGRGSRLQLTGQQHPCASTGRCTVSSHGRRSAGFREPAARCLCGDANARSNAGFSSLRGWLPGDIFLN